MEKRNDSWASFGHVSGYKFEKMAGFSSIVQTNILTVLIESWCILFMENLFFSHKINLKTVSEPFIFPRFTRNFGAKRDFIHKYSLHVAYLQISH